MKNLIFLFVLLCSSAVAQNPTPPNQPTKVEVTVSDKTAKAQKDSAKDVEVAIAKQEAIQAKYQVLQGQIAQAQAPLQQSYAAQQAIIDAYVKAVKEAMGWGDDVTFEPSNMKFYRTTKPIAPTLHKHDE